MAFKGFTWNLTPAQALLLLALLDSIEKYAVYRVDRDVAGWFRVSLENYLEVVPDGTAWEDSAYPSA